jgi:teichuronic acid biosynthesis glycosyltransferase TuaC
MKVLFVSSANKKDEINPVVFNQGQSLSREGIEIYYFGVRGKGLTGYLSNVNSLKTELMVLKPDIVHAHYVLSGVLAKLAGARPLVVSLMGSDVNDGHLQRMAAALFSRYFWDACIVKTEEMKKLIRNEHVHIIPNGVDMTRFRPGGKEEALTETGWDKNAINVLFPADPDRPEKNFRLAQEAVKTIGDDNVRLQILKDVPRDKVVHYLNASDVVLLTSLWEGSPNIIKEAMACNIPVVSTKVGDVEEVLMGTDGCYVVKDSVGEICSALRSAISKKRTDGRNHIAYLDSGLVSRRIIELYSDLLMS